MSTRSSVVATEKATDNSSNIPLSGKSTKITKEMEKFLFTYQEEPHRSRRKEIIKAHPEVTKLVGHEPLTKYIVIGVVSLQLTCALALRNSNLSDWKFWLVAYFVGATCDSNLFLAIHEFSHNLGFKKPVHNKLFSIFTNLPIGIPYSAGFGPYHLLHHKHMGEPEFDTDLPTPLEAMVLSSVAGKAFFATFQLLFYAIRPVCVVEVKFTWVHWINIVTQILFDVAIIKSFGWMPIYYMVASAFLAGSLHPIAGHFIAEHYVLDPPKSHDPNAIELPETYSYYGPLNVFVYNAGLHNEHHDFPYIPWSRLQKLHDIASEFYDPLPYHTSWVKVIWNFVFDDRVSLWCRVQRESKPRVF
jgi:sphingolipid 4-desaturase/C4-monooxygenase